MSEVSFDNVKVPSIMEYIRLSRRAVVRGLAVLILLFSIFFFSLYWKPGSDLERCILISIFYGVMFAVAIGYWNLMNKYLYLKKIIAMFRLYREEFGERLSIWLSAGDASSKNNFFYLNLLCEYNGCIYWIRPRDLILLCKAKSANDLRELAVKIRQEAGDRLVGIHAYGLFLKIKSPGEKELMPSIEKLYKVFDQGREVLQPIKMQ